MKSGKYGSSVPSISSEMPEPLRHSDELLQSVAKIEEELMAVKNALKEEMAV